MGVWGNLPLMHWHLRANKLLLVGVCTEPGDLASEDIKLRTVNLQVHVLDCIGEDLAVLEQALHANEDVELDGILDLFLFAGIWHLLHSSGGCLVELHEQAADASWDILNGCVLAHALHSRSDCSALVVAVDNQELGLQRGVGELSGAEESTLTLDDVASRAHHKEIARSLVEVELHRLAGVGAGQDGGHRLLALGSELAQDKGVSGRNNLTLLVGETTVSSHKSGESFRWWHRWRGGDPHSVILGRGFHQCCLLWMDAQHLHLSCLSVDVCTVELNLALLHLGEDCGAVLEQHFDRVPHIELHRKVQQCVK
mmetsp:Transcript_4993/g.11014  ORF Transcript_4993/g.11014 Transcript_4993/m.11014 type:complete len:312 (-) Transcript_4993:751-1686(-)